MNAMDEAMSENIFSDRVMDHFTNPRNVGYLPEADGEGTFGDPDCGDYLEIYIRVRDGVISEIKFLVFGCAAAIATSSMTTELAAGRTLEEAYGITEDDIIEALGGLPEHKRHCSMLGTGALREAIINYAKKKGLLSA
jgi:nitrogen fixation NifU-like protein